MKISKKHIQTLIITLGLLLIPVIVIVGIWISEVSSAKDSYITNVFSDSATLVVLKSGATKLPVSSSVIYVDGEKVPVCSNVTEQVICRSHSEENQYYSYYEIDNLSPDSGYVIGWSDTLKGKIIKTKDLELKVATKGIDENIPQVDRIYGRVTDDTDNGVEDVLVIVKNIDDEQAPLLSGITTDTGTYNITYLNDISDNYIQDVYVYSSEGSETIYRTASFYNKPVKDIIVNNNSQQDSNILSMLSGDVYAANTCITDTTMGGIRAQCNSNMDWAYQLDTATCPKSEYKFKLGVVKHTDTVKFHNPDGVTLKLYDEAAKEFVKDPDNPGKDLVVKNGAYVEIKKVQLKLGNKYLIKAYEGEKECTNSTEKDPYVIYNEPNGSKSANPSPTPNSPGNGFIPAPTSNMDLCKKVGENFAIIYEIPVDKMQAAVGLRMHWGEAMITDLGGIDAYKNSVINGANVGMNVILRICYQGNCNIFDGNAYGNAIVRVYNELKSTGQLPQNGLFIHAGHNEPNVSEYKDPAQEAQFVSDVISVLQNAGILSQDPDDIGVKAISPNFDLYRQGDGNWDGCSDCSDPNPHPIYTAASYLNEMLKNSSFASKAKLLYAWAVNDYLLDRGTTNITDDVKAFSSLLKSKGLSDTIAVTEFGRINTGLGWDTLAAQIRELDNMENVAIMLLFNSLGSNPDAAFTYHSDLWNDASIVQGLLSSCGSGNFNVPQEGKTNVYVQPGTTATGNSRTVGVASFTSNPASSGTYGSTKIGTDQCSNGICVGQGYLQNTTANGGLLNGNFEAPFLPDGANELHVPKYWHAWYQNGCYQDKCGSYSCTSDGAICRRPEYKQSSGFDNRLSPLEYGGSKASAQWFTTYGTMYAGLFQHIYLGEGSASGNSVNNLVFSASGSSWSQDYDKDGNPVDTPNKFIGRVGIDPSGGIDPTSGSVIWSDWKELPNVGPSGTSNFSENSVSASTNSERITVFIAANNEWPFKNSDTYWDNARLMVNGNLAIGDETKSTSDGYGPVDSVCENGMTGGANGESCWDPELEGYEASAIVDGVGGDLVMGATTITLPERGEYVVSSEIFEFSNDKVYNYGRDPMEVPVFQDRDMDGVHDDDEFYVPSTMDLGFEKVGDVLEYELKPGIMMISIPFYTEDFNSAVEIVNEIAKQGGVVSSVASYTNAANDIGWKSVSSRGVQVYGDDFELSPGDAMYLVVQEGVKVKISGQSYVSPVQEYVKKGWNLIGIKGDAVEMSASELLSALNELPGVVATKITIWDTERGRFVSYIEEDGSVYGENFTINEMVGVFVFVKDGVGYWTPSD